MGFAPRQRSANQISLVSNRLHLNPRPCNCSPCPESPPPSRPSTRLALSSSPLQGAHAQLIYMTECAGIWPERVYHFSQHSSIINHPPLAPPDPTRTKYSHAVITETLSNIYMKIDSIILAEQETFAHFSLLGVQFLTHHHWLEETIICRSLITS